MNKILSMLLLFCCIVVMSFRCNRDECEGAICTMEFRMLTVDIQDMSGSALPIDKVETVFNGTVIHSSTTPLNASTNTYVIADDGDKSEFGLNSQQNVSVNVFKNNQIVKTASYIIKADCCHISKISGDDQIIIP